MKKLCINWMILLVFIIGPNFNVLSQNLFGQTNSISLEHSNEILNGITICKWKGGALTSVNLSFDDNNPSHRQISLLLDQYGFRGSFFVIPVHLLVDDLKDILLRGHEIGNHTYTHPDCNKLDSLGLEIEISKGKECIEKELGISCSSFAVPFHSNTPLIRKIGFENHLFIRNVSEYPDTKRTRVDLGSAITIQFIDSTLQACIKNGRMLLLTGHGIDGDGWDPISSDFLKQMLDTLKSQSNKGVVWVSTLKELAQYENLVHEVQLDKQIIGDTLIIKIEGYCNNKYIELCESTLSLKLSKSCNDSIRYLDKDLYLTQMCNSDIITIDLKKSQIIKAIYFKKLKTESINIVQAEWSVFPNPATDYINILSGLPILKTEVHNLNGQIMIVKSGNIHQLDTSALMPGIYVIQISTRNSSFTKKITITQ